MPNRIEREIEEILSRLDEFVPEESRSRRLRRRTGAVLAGLSDRLRAATRRISGGHVVLGAAVLLLLAMLLRPSFPLVARWATYAGLAVIFVAIFLAIKPVHRRQPSRYWRGPPIDIRLHSLLHRPRVLWRRRNRLRF